MTHYGRPFWLHRIPEARRPSWPRLRDALACDVAIVGGGLTGCTTAYLLAGAGIRTCLLEADRVGRGATAASAGLIRPQPCAGFADLERAYGRRVARRMWEMSRHAALDLATLLRRLRIRCDLEPCDVFAIAINEEDEVLLRREHKALAGAGLDAAWLNAARLTRELRVDARGAIRTAGGASVDPYRACLGLARAAVMKGARIFERSQVVRVRTGRAGVELETRGGPVAARSVVIATSGPAPLFRPLQRHFSRVHTYATVTPPLEGPLRREFGRQKAALTVGAGASRLLARTKDDRVVFAGADQPQIPDRRRPKTIVQRTGQLMYELSLLYSGVSGVEPQHGWDAAIAQTGDGVVYAGPHRNYPHHLFALGTGHNGPASALLSARILFRRYTGAPAAGDEVFGFNR